jgi:hypothetical protein
VQKSKDNSGAAFPPLGTEQEGRLLTSARSYLQAGLALKNWWRDVSARNDFQERFKEMLVFNWPDSSFGFFDQALIDGRPTPVMGNFQTVDYDRPKSQPSGRSLAADFMQTQMREFVLRYFMRVSDFREPEAHTPPRDSSPGPPLDWLSWCPKEYLSKKGFGFSQLYYKPCGSEGIGRFPECKRTAIVDLREIGSVYDWIILWVQIFDFQFRVSPFGSDFPELTLPLKTGSYLVISPEFVIFDDHPSSVDELGRYGLGYAFIRNPAASVLGYGPGEFDAAFELIEFIVFKDGRVRVDLAFVTNVPDRILSLSMDPFFWTAVAWDATCRLLGWAPFAMARKLGRLSPLNGLKFDPVFGFVRAANLLTAGRAERDFCVSEKQILKGFLLKHVEQHFHTITGSLRTWRHIPDWTDEGALPAWVVSGTSA